MVLDQYAFVIRKRRANKDKACTDCKTMIKRSEKYASVEATFHLDQLAKGRPEIRTVQLPRCLRCIEPLIDPFAKGIGKA